MRHCERSVAIPKIQSGSTNRGLPRCARNDVFYFCLDRKCVLSLNSLSQTNTDHTPIHRSL
jgi:hypothetical protein